jgi:hypothetical protein
VVAVAVVVVAERHVAWGGGNSKSMEHESSVCPPPSVRLRLFLAPCARVGEASCGGNIPSRFTSNSLHLMRTGEV